jgi:hypothetical protein
VLGLKRPGKSGRCASSIVVRGPQVPCPDRRRQDENIYSAYPQFHPHVYRCHQRPAWPPRRLAAGRSAARALTCAEFVTMTHGFQLERAKIGTWPRWPSLSRHRARLEFWPTSNGVRGSGARRAGWHQARHRPVRLQQGLLVPPLGCVHRVSGCGNG